MRAVGELGEPQREWRRELGELRGAARQSKTLHGTKEKKTLTVVVE